MREYSFDSSKNVSEPLQLEHIVNSRNNKLLYNALKNINFSYSSLFTYLTNAFYFNNALAKKSKSEQISDLMEISESTFYRWKKSDKLVEEKYAERLSELILLYSYGEEVFESREMFIEWMNSPNIHFDMGLPIDHLDSFPGVRYVHHLLAKIEHGAPV